MRLPRFLVDITTPQTCSCGTLLHRPTLVCPRSLARPWKFKGGAQVWETRTVAAHPGAPDGWVRSGVWPPGPYPAPGATRNRRLVDDPESLCDFDGFRCVRQGHRRGSELPARRLLGNHEGFFCFVFVRGPPACPTFPTHLTTPHRLTKHYIHHTKTHHTTHTHRHPKHTKNAKPHHTPNNKYSTPPHHTIQE